MEIRIQVGSLTLNAQLNESPTAKKIFEALPFSTPFDTWGDEIYFSIPVTAQLDDTAMEAVSLGDLGYWPPGSAFCIFFGPTPMSTEGNIVPASAVNVFGKVKGDVLRLKSVMHEGNIHVDKV